jgi:hypothetical protein
MPNQFKIKNGIIIEDVQGGSSLTEILVINDTTGLVEKRNQIPTSSITNFNLEVSRSAASSGFGNFTLNGTDVYSSSQQISDTNVFLEKQGDNVISSSQQVNFSLISSVPSGIVSSSDQVEFSLLSGLPSGIISNSQQVNYSLIDGIPNGIVSSSTQISSLGFYSNNSNVVLNDVSINGTITASNLPSNGSERTPLVIDGNGNIFVGSDYTADTGDINVDMVAPDQPNAILISTVSGSKNIQQIDTTADFLGFDIENVGAILGSNILSSSTQVQNYNLFLEKTGDNVVSSSTQVQNYDLFLEKTGDNVVSSSAQIDYTQLSSIPNNIVSSSTQIQNYNVFLEKTGDNVVTSSAQVQNYNLFLEKTGDNVVSSSAQINYSQLSNIPNDIVSSSEQLGLSSTDDVTFNTVTVKEVIAEQFIVSSSVSYITTSFSSGSTKFGDTYDDTHQFSGSVSISGSFAVKNSSGNSIFEVGNDGVLKHTSATGTSISSDTTILSVSRTSYRSLHVTYHLYNSTQDAFRSGMVNYVWNSGNSTYEYTEFTTNDLGNSTSGIEFSGSFTGTTFDAKLKRTSGTWNVNMRGNVL